jgi:hypothetical protein
VRAVIYFAIVLLLAALDHACLSRWWWAPDLSLAFAAWAMVDGDEDGVVWRALLAGLARELCDPAGGGFQLLTLTLLGVAFLPIRRFLFRSRGAAWAIAAAALFLAMTLVDSVLTGPGDADSRRLVTATATTALGAVGCGWLFGGLPRVLRPIVPGGA